MQRLGGLFVVGMFVLLMFSGSGGAQGCSHNDAGSCKDAGSDQGSALTISQGRHYGTLTTTTDTKDYYRFTVSGTRPVIEVQLLSDPNNDFNVDLQATGASETAPTSRARGDNGAKVIQYQGNPTGTWYLYVRGSTTGRYELTLLIRPENDDNRSLDAANVQDPQSMGAAIPLSRLRLGNFVTARGNLTNGDPGDSYRISIESYDTRNLFIATLQFSPQASLMVDIINPGVHFETQRSGPGAASVILERNGNLMLPEEIGIRVAAAGTNTDNDDWQAGHYVLQVRADRPTAKDAHGGEDAPNDWAGGVDTTRLAEGLRFGYLTTGNPVTGVGSDPHDWYLLDNPSENRVIHLALGPVRADSARTVPLLRLEVYHQSTGGGEPILKAEITPCDQARGVAVSGAPGKWLIGVHEAVGFGGCNAGSTGARAGDYVLLVHLARQLDHNYLDAPTALTNTPNAGTATLNSAWFDANDGLPAPGARSYDSFNAGKMEPGSTVRVGIYGTTPGMEFRIQLYDANQTLVSQSAQSTNGVIRLHATAPRRENYTVRFEHVSSGTDGLPHSGIYRYSISSTINDAPGAVTLNAPPDADIGTTSVKLTWSKSADADFSKYEVHASKTAGFTPTSTTRKVTVSNRDTTTAAVTGLDAGAVYEFLVRVEDTSTLGTNSNRRTVDLKEINLNNQAPTLTSPSHSPESGQAGTRFTFRVTYNDQNGDEPIQSSVFIDSVERLMTRVSGSPTTGAVYQYQTTLAVGNHNYYFLFNDGDASVRNPSGTATHGGPTVTSPGNTAPTVTASANPNQGTAPLTVQFTATVSDTSGDSHTYSWDFDTSDGIQVDSNQQNPTHTYNTAGTKTARVRVVDQGGAEANANVVVTVQGSGNQLPTITASGTPTTGAAPLRVQFSATASDPDGTIVGYEWDFDQSNGVAVDSTQQNPQFEYTVGGTFVATATAIDDDGGRRSTTVTITVSGGNNRPPSVTISASPLSGPAPLTVAFTANAADPDGDALSYTWDFDVSNGIQADATGATSTHTFAQNGQYTVLVTVRDARSATATATVVITVGASSEQGSLVFIQATPTRGQAPLTVRFEADVTRLPSAPVRYEWDFGDGSAVETTPETMHVFQTSGRYVVRLTVTDQAGTEYDSTVSIDVQRKNTSPSTGLLVYGIVLGTMLWFRRRRAQDL